MTSSTDLQKINDKLEKIDNKLNLLITQRAVDEYRLSKLEENQKGAIKVAVTAIVSSVSSLVFFLGKYVITKLGVM